MLRPKIHIFQILVQNGSPWGHVLSPKVLECFDNLGENLNLGGMQMPKSALHFRLSQEKESW